MSCFYSDRYVDASPHDPVSFSVVCRPAAGISLDRLCGWINRETLDDCLPTEETKTRVTQQLLALGFEVFGEPVPMNPGVSARGSVELFRSVFTVRLTKRIRHIKTEWSEYDVETIVLEKGSPEPSPSVIEGAIYIAMVEPPLPAAPRLPPDTPRFCLHLPGDVAQLLNASAVHRKGCTGAGVTVAVIDGGFANHPYYRENAYDIRRSAAPDSTGDPFVDDEPHGTEIIANLFACAPDVTLRAIKRGDNPVVSLLYAITTPPFPQVISLSWFYPEPGIVAIPPDRILLALMIELLVVVAGVTVVVAAGDGQLSTFPAMMQDVIAVGGIAIDEADKLTLGAASRFDSPIQRGRHVPDFCGISSQMILPTTPDAAEVMWHCGNGGTSSAAPQIAGVCALLLQKNPTLAPAQIKRKLHDHANPILGAVAPVEDYLLVDALKAWA